MTNFIIDTNFLARILIKDNQSQLDEIMSFIDQAVDNKWFLVVDKSVVFELVFVLSGKIYQLTKIEVKEKINSLLNLKCFTFEDKDLLIQALKISAEHNLDIVDTYLISKSINNNSELKTFDRKMLRILEKIRMEKVQIQNKKPHF
jgi:predicted nucleic-acid-binding protein